MSDKSEYSGSCLCGAVHISATLTDNAIGACHCSMCRKWGGGPLFAKEVGSDVQFAGEENITVFNSSEWAERGFCKQCGTHLFYRLKQGGFYALPVGLFDNNDWQFDHQVFIDEKPAFYGFTNKTRDMTGAEVFAQFSHPE